MYTYILYILYIRIYCIYYIIYTYILYILYTHVVSIIKPHVGQSWWKRPTGPSTTVRFLPRVPGRFERIPGSHPAVPWRLVPSGMSVYITMRNDYL